MSADFSAWLLGSPSRYSSDVAWGWYKPMLGVDHVLSQAAYSKLEAVSSLWLIPTGLAVPRLGQAALQSWVLSALCTGVC